MKTFKWYRKALGLKYHILKKEWIKLKLQNG